MSEVPRDIIAEFDRSVLPRLRGLLNRVRLYLAVEGVAHLSIVFMICFVVQISVDWFFRLRVDLRGGLLVGVLIALFLTLWRKCVRPLTTPLQVDDVAEVLEGRFPQMQSRLISAVQFARGQVGPADCNSPSLIERVIEQAETQSRDLPLLDVLNHRRARFHGGVICGVLGLFVVLTWAAPLAMGTWFDRNILLGNAAWKQNTHLTVLNDEDRDGIIHCPRGDDLLIRVRASGVRPRQVTIDLAFESRDSDRSTMTAVGADEFHFGLTKVNDALSFRVRGGDARHDRVEVVLVDRPRLTDATITITPPAYTELPPYELRAGKTLIEVLQGGEVEIRFATNKDITRALLMRDQSEVGVVREDPDGFRVRFKPTQNAAYTFALTDALGLENRKARQFSVRMVPDAPPVVSLKAEGVGDLVTPQAVLPLEMQFKDRYGLDSAELVHQLSGEENAPVSIVIEQLERGAKQLTTSDRLRLADLGAQEGRLLLLHAQARDLNDFNGPGVGSSAKYALRVVSPEELLIELGRREQEFRQEFERVIDMQEKLRNDLLSVAAAFRVDPTSSGRSVNFSVLQRRQRQFARQVAHVAGQFERIHAELVINQLDSEQTQERLVVAIVQPLDELATRGLTGAADRIDTLRGNATQARFGSADREQAAILEEMRRILASMAKWEGFHETISLMQSIIKLQKSLREETDAMLNQQLEELFGGEEDGEKDE